VPRKVFVAGEILTAADVNTNLMDQAVQRFADSAARTTAIPSPTEGMTSYLDDLNRIEVYTGAVWSAVGTVLQVASATKTDTFTTTSTSPTTITGLSVSITPSSTSSKVLVMAQIVMGTGGSAYVGLSGGGSADFRGDAAASRARAAAGFTARNGSTYTIERDARPHTLVFLDSPNTTSSVTYNATTFAHSGQTSFINRTSDDTNNTEYGRYASSITVMEVAG
jgi:hypothetical protein